MISAEPLEIPPEMVYNIEKAKRRHINESYTCKRKPPRKGLHLYCA